ncbi:hypothetical protein A6M27_19650 [Acidithiobacillus thiooxidans]|nr:hypothetical protein A6M27_19650 [Acidithiobacillus thiooxidans]
MLMALLLLSSPRSAGLFYSGYFGLSRGELLENLFGKQIFHAAVVLERAFSFAAGAAGKSQTQGHGAG